MTTPIDADSWLTTGAAPAPTPYDFNGYVIVCTDTDNQQSAIDATVMLTQCHRGTGRIRAVLGAACPETGELIAAPDWPGFVQTKPRWQWLTQGFKAGTRQ